MLKFSRDCPFFPQICLNLFSCQYNKNKDINNLLLRVSFNHVWEISWNYLKMQNSAQWTSNFQNPKLTIVNSLPYFLLVFNLIKKLNITDKQICNPLPQLLRSNHYDGTYPSSTFFLKYKYLYLPAKNPQKQTKENIYCWVHMFLNIL